MWRWREHITCVLLVPIVHGSPLLRTPALASESTAGSAETEPPRGGPARLPAAASQADSDTARVEGSVEVLAATSYVWRGDLYSDDLFDPNLQSYAELTINELGTGWLTASAWALMPAAGGGNEVDPLLAYGFPLGKVLEVELGYTIYVGLAPLDDYMHEAFVDLTVTGGLPVYPVSGVAVDFVRTHGAYAYVGLATTIEGERASLEARATEGMSGYDGVDVGVQDVTVSAIGSYNLTRVLYCSLVAGFSYAARTHDANPWSGVAAGASF